MAKLDEKKESTTRSNFPKLRSQFALVIFAITFALLLFWTLDNIRSIFDFAGRIISLILPIIYGFVIAFILNLFMRPLENLWDKIFKKHKPKFFIKRTVCMFLSIVLVLTVIFAILFLILPAFIQTTDSLITLLPKYFDSFGGTFQNLKAFLIDMGVSFSDFASVDNMDLLSKLGKMLPKFGMNFFNTTYSLTTSLFSGIINFVLAAVFAFYMLAQKETLCLCSKKLLYAIFPKKFSDKTMSVFTLINQTFTRFATVQFAEAVILGVMCFIGMLIFRFPYAVVISVLVGATALIPVVGAWIGVIAGTFLILIESPMQAFWFIIFFLVLQQIEGNFIYPKVVGKSIGLPGILVLAAVTVGGNAYGVVGMLIGVPVFSVLFVLSKEFVTKKLKEKKLKL